MLRYLEDREAQSNPSVLTGGLFNLLDLQEISAGLLAVLQPLAAPGSTAGPQSREQAARIVSYLTPLAVGPAPSAEAGEALAVQTAFGAKLLPNPNWPLNEGWDAERLLHLALTHQHVPRQ